MRFVGGADRDQATLLPECLEDWVEEDNPVRVIDAFIDALNLGDLGFTRFDPKSTGRPSYHPTVLLKLYVYGYLNQVSSGRRLEREAGRNMEVMWLTGRFVPDHKTIADFRGDNGPAIRKVRARFVAKHFLMKRLKNVATEMALHVLAYNLTRMMNFIGTKPLIAAIRAQGGVCNHPSTVNETG